MITSPGPESSAWVKSTYSNPDGGNCVEWAPAFATAEAVPVRDSKAPHGPTLGFSPDAWRSFVAAVVSDEFGIV